MIADHFSNITDTRAPWKIKHSLIEIIVMVIVAIAADCDSWEDIADYCKAKEKWMKDRLGMKLQNGIPSHDTLQRVFGMIKPTEFEKSFVEWMKETTNITSGEIISIDGKTLRGSKDKNKKPLHMVSAWANANQMVLGELATDEKSNEITAVPKLIEMLDVSGCIVTADAMSCQKTISKSITENGADYVIGLKENQPTLRDDVSSYFDDAFNNPKHYPEIMTKTTFDKGHGRIEKRQYFLATNIDWLYNRQEWSNLNGIGAVKSTVETNSTVTEDIRYYITSLTDIEQFQRAVRAHWSIENSLHWCLDVVFDEDHIRMRKDNTAENVAVVRHLVINTLKNYPTERTMSLKRKRKRCCYDDEFLASVIKFLLDDFHA